MSKQQIGVIGMAVMGRNLALNMASRGYRVAIYNRSPAKTDEVMALHPDSGLTPFHEIERFVTALETPRRVLLMVKAGEATDKMIDALKPHLEPGDIVIDAGNTHYQDTRRRAAELKALGLEFIGTGVSGGEEGALRGPAIMPGGEPQAYEMVAPIFEQIAARAGDQPCVAYMGPDGAGHYVKMVHNGIEYGDMQLIAESYAILKQGLGLDNPMLAEVFDGWNQGELSSYLIEITARIFDKCDEETGQALVDLILDQAGQKGTGKWTSQSALDLGVALPLITESVFARNLSALKAERLKASRILAGPSDPVRPADSGRFIELVRRALYLSKILSYAQGFAQLRAASNEYGWNLHYDEIARVFRAGCIIRAQFLQHISDAYAAEPELANLLLAPYFRDIAAEYQQALREVVAFAVQSGIAVPTFAAAIAYYDGYRSERLPANLIQAQRDFFGAHTYERTDRPGIFHTEWQ